MANITVICTNDLHSCADQYGVLREAQNALEQDQPVLKVDGGDWFSGTIYSWLSPRPTIERCVELEYFHENNIVANLGNHEFDATVNGLAYMLGKAAKLGYQKLVCSNIKMRQDCTLRQYYSENLKDPNVLNECVVEDIPGFGKVGILGLIGDDAIFGCQANTSGQGLVFLKMEDAIAKCRPLVARLRNQDGCCLVLLLFHGGKEELDISATQAIFDFVVCAHTHEAYVASQGMRMSQAGSYGLCLGVHKLAVEQGQRPRLITSELVQLMPSSVRHPSYSSHVRPLLTELGVPDLEIPVARLPREARVPIERRVDCPFATWVCDGLLSEISELFQQPVDGFFVAHELIRGDLTMPKNGSLSIADVASVLECGQSSANDIGVLIQLIETTPFQLFVLHSAFLIGHNFITANALPAYSTTFFAANKSPYNVMTGKKLRIATTKFIADNLRLIPRVLFDATNVVMERQASLSILLYKHIIKTTHARI